MPAGHAVLVILIAFVVGTLLNADAMMHTAETLPLGSTKRSVSVAVMRPIKWTADHLAITEPRRLIDEALGKQQHTVKDPFSGIANGTAPPTVPHPTTPATTTPGSR